MQIYRSKKLIILAFWQKCVNKVAKIIKNDSKICKCQKFFVPLYAKLCAHENTRIYKSTCVKKRHTQLNAQSRDRYC